MGSVGKIKVPMLIQYKHRKRQTFALLLAKPNRDPTSNGLIKKEMHY